jgi:hypothetical protein
MEMAGALRATKAYMAEAVYDPIMRQNPVCDDEILKLSFQYRRPVNRALAVISLSRSSELVTRDDIMECPDRCSWHQPQP